MDAGTKIIFEAALDESHWLDVGSGLLANAADKWPGIQKFLSEWQKLYKLSPEFKVVIADMQTFLHDLRLWLDQVEMDACKPSPPPSAKNWSAESWRS